MYLLFEFMENGCLSDFLRGNRGSVSPEALLGMCLDVCEGMAYLESTNFIHRDLVRNRSLSWPTLHCTAVNAAVLTLTLE